MKRHFIGALLAGTLAGGIALAAQTVEGTDPATPAKGKGAAGWLIRHGDTNGDGALSRDEFMAQAAAHFAQMDTNKDGKVTEDEVRAAMAAHRAMWGGHGGRGGPGMVPPPGGPGGAGMAPPPEGPGGPGAGMLAHLDANHDGKISRAEFNAPGDRHFEMLDTNHDGVIDVAELKAADDQMRARMQEMRGKWRQRGADGDAPPPPPPPPAPDANNAG